MIDPRTGNVTMLGTELPDGTALSALLVVQGTEDAIHQAATNIRLGAAERERRAARRRQQKASRRTNR